MIATIDSSPQESALIASALIASAPVVSVEDPDPREEAKEECKEAPSPKSEFNSKKRWGFL